MLKYGFFNSVNGDRKYNADDMTRPYRLIVSDGIIANQNGQISDSLKVKYAGGRQVKVISGNGMFGGHWLEMTADEILNVPTPHTQYTRIDAVIIRVDEDLRTLSLKYIQGTPNASPVAPTMQRSNTIKDYRLANITVLANTTEITQSNISDTRPSSDCGIVTNLLQNSDISSTFEQWESQFNDWLANNNSNYGSWKNEQETNFSNWTTNKKTEYNQFVTTEQAEYNEWTENKKTEYEEWFGNLTKDLIVNEAFQTFTSVYTAQNDDEKTIPINISAFSSNVDILTVHINGLKLIPNVDYTLNGFNAITLSKGIDAGTIVAFYLLKTISISDSDIGNVVSELQRINNIIPAEATETNKLVTKAYVDSLAINVVDETEQNSGGSDVNSMHFSYVVDSDQAFVDWVNNKSGNDYTSVLIRKGEWTATKGVNLTTTGTKVVVGEPGSKLKFTPTAGINCLAYNTTPTTSDYYINGVNVEGVSVTVCFRNCANLTNCMGVGVTQGDGFIDCLNLTNCTAVAYGNVNGNAFNSCENLTNCKGTATGGNNGYGFQNCNNLTNCEGVGKGSYMPAGFRNCVSLTNCKGTGEGGTNGYGFQGCTLVSKCKAGGKSTIRVFDTSYASQAKTTAYACADTPEGGFNDPTNPTA